MTRTPIILDTDPGIDDAVALAAALFAPQLDLKLITTVAGNVSVDKTTRNALQLLEFWQKETPVAKGASVPLCARCGMQLMCTASQAWKGMSSPKHLVVNCRCLHSRPCTIV